MSGDGNEENDGDIGEEKEETGSRERILEWSTTLTSSLRE